jgi:hypothetical protein
LEKAARSTESASNAFFQAHHRDVVVAEAGFGEFPLLGYAGRDDRDFEVAVFRVVLADHFYGVQHGAVDGREEGEQLRVVQLYVADYGRAGLRDHHPGLLLFDVVDVRKRGELRAEAGVEHGRHADRLEVAVQPEVVVGEDGDRRRVHYGYDPRAALQVAAQALEVVDRAAGAVRAHHYALAAAYAQVVVDRHAIPDVAHAEPGRAFGQARVAPEALFFVDFYDSVEPV